MGRLARPKGGLALAAGMVLAGTALLTSRASAQFYWDPGHTPLSPSGGSGVWDNVTPNWADPSQGADVPLNSLVDAVFVGQGGTITTAGGPYCGTLILDAAGYTFEGIGDPGRITINYGLTQSASISGTNVIACPILAGSSLNVNGGILRITNTDPQHFNSYANASFEVAAGATLEFVAAPKYSAINETAIRLNGGTLRIDTSAYPGPLADTADQISVTQSSSVVLSGPSAADLTFWGLTFGDGMPQQGGPIVLNVTGMPGSIMHFADLNPNGARRIGIKNSVDIYTGASYMDAIDVLTKTGLGKLALTSASYQSSAIIDVQEGTLELQGTWLKNGAAGGATVQLNGGSLVLNHNGGGVSFNNPLIVTPAGGVVEAQDGNLILQQTAGGVTINGPLLVDTYKPGSPAALADLTVRSSITGSGGLQKNGPGYLVLEGGGTYTGATDVKEGTLYVMGSLASAVTVESGAALSGGATLLGDLVFADPRAKFPVMLATNTALGYDQFYFARNVTLSGAELSVDEGGNIEPLGKTIWIFDGLPGSIAVSGLFTFDGNLLENGEVFTSAGGVQYRIDYNIAGDPQGSGNDVLLTVVPEPAGLSLLALGAVGLLGRRRLSLD